MQPAFIKTGNWLLIAALSIAFGGHWVVLQSVAWTRMMVENARRTELRAAVSQTFDGAHPCALCKSIEKGRQEEKKQEVPLVVTKLILFHYAPTMKLWQPQDYRRLETADVFSQTLAVPPPVPPPRTFPS
jgi:hypothetical protein